MLPAQEEEEEGVVFDDDELSISLFDEEFDFNNPVINNRFFPLECDLQEEGNKDEASAAAKSPVAVNSQLEEKTITSPKKGRRANIFEIEFEDSIHACSHPLSTLHPLKRSKNESCFIREVGAYGNCTLCGESTNLACVTCNMMVCPDFKLMCCNKEILTKQKFKTGKKATVQTLKTIMTCDRLHPLFTKHDLLPIPSNLPFLQEAAKEELDGLKFNY
jgi:hypothetical protein